MRSKHCGVPYNLSICNNTLNLITSPFLYIWHVSSSVKAPCLEILVTKFWKWECVKKKKKNTQKNTAHIYKWPIPSRAHALNYDIIKDYHLCLLWASFTWSKFNTYSFAIISKKAESNSMERFCCCIISWTNTTANSLKYVQRVIINLISQSKAVLSAM